MVFYAKYIFSFEFYVLWSGKNTLLLFNSIHQKQLCKIIKIRPLINIKFCNCVWLKLRLLRFIASVVGSFLTSFAYGKMSLLSAFIPNEYWMKNLRTKSPKTQNILFTKLKLKNWIHFLIQYYIWFLFLIHTYSLQILLKCI